MLGGWTRSNAEYTDRAAHDTWAQEEITWGQWSKPEREVQILPDVNGKDVIELGCGTAYISAWLARRGARSVARDAGHGAGLAAPDQSTSMPAFELPDANGETFRSADLQGKVVVVRFWATW